MVVLPHRWPPRQHQVGHQNTLTLLDKEAEDGRTNSSTAQGPLSHLQSKELNVTPKWQHSHLELDKTNSCWISTITM